MYQRVFLLKWYLQYYFLYDIEQIKKRKEACQKQVSGVYGVLIQCIWNILLPVCHQRQLHSKVHLFLKMQDTQHYPQISL